MITQIHVGFTNSNLFILFSKTIYFEYDFFDFANVFLVNIEFTILNKFFLENSIFFIGSDYPIIINNSQTFEFFASPNIKSYYIKYSLITHRKSNDNIFDTDSVHVTAGRWSK